MLVVARRANRTSGEPIR